MAIAYPHFFGSEKAKNLKPSLMVTPTPSPVILSQDELKKIAAYKAVEFVESGMVLGLGTGSTAKHAIDRITHEQAVSLGIPLSDLNAHPILDLAIDGADEVTHK